MWSVIIMVLVGLSVYYLFFRGIAQKQVSLTDQNFLNLTKLKVLKIDTSFFADSEFSNLQESPKPNLDAVQKGRSNPFLPFGKR